MYRFEIGSVYSFEVYGSVVLGNNYTNVKVLAEMDSTTARAFIDLPAMHENIYPHLPLGTSDDLHSYKYLKIEGSNTGSTIIAIPWIKLETVQLVQTATITAQIFNVNSTDAINIRDILNANGYLNIKITVSGTELN